MAGETLPAMMTLLQWNYRRKYKAPAMAGETLDDGGGRALRDVASTKPLRWLVKLFNSNSFNQIRILRLMREPAVMNKYASRSAPIIPQYADFTVARTLRYIAIAQGSRTLCFASPF